MTETASAWPEVEGAFLLLFLLESVFTDRYPARVFKLAMFAALRLAVAVLAAVGAVAEQAPGLPLITPAPTNFPTGLQLGFSAQTPSSTPLEGDLKRRQNAQTCAFLGGNPGESQTIICRPLRSNKSKPPPSTAPPVYNAPPTPSLAKRGAVPRTRPAPSPPLVSPTWRWISAKTAALMTLS